MLEDPAPNMKNISKKHMLIMAGTPGYVAPDGAKKIYHGKGLYTVSSSYGEPNYEAYVIEPQAYVAGRKRVMHYICGPLFDKLTDGHSRKISMGFYKATSTLVICMTTNDKEILKLWPHKFYFEPVLVEPFNMELWSFTKRYFKALKWVKKLTEYHQKNTKYKEARMCILDYATGALPRLSTLASKFPPKPSNKLAQRKYREQRSTT